MDILQQGDGGAFDLVEVKSSTRVKPEHVPDLAIQMYVLESLGVSLNSAYLMHINNQYVYPGGDYDLEELFTLGDVTAPTKRFVAESVPGDLPRMWEVLQEEDPPAIGTGRHCTSPYPCPFFGHCHQGETVGADAAVGEAAVSRNLGSQLLGDQIPCWIPGLRDLHASPAGLCWH